MNLYIVGKHVGTDWEFQGVFDDIKLAEEACLNYLYFIGPATLNEVLGDDSEEWVGAYCPKLAIPE